MEVGATGAGIFSTAGRGLAFKSRVRRSTKVRGAWSAETRRQIDSLCEFVANGGSAAAWARKMGLSQSRASYLWRMVVANYGWQAQ